MTRVQAEPRSFDQGRRKNDAFTQSAMLPSNSIAYGYSMACTVIAL